MTHVCDCQTLEPRPTTEGVALYAPSTHVRRRLGALLRLDGSVREEGQALVLERGAFEALEPVSAMLSSTERAEVLVAPWEPGGPRPWEAAPLEDWVRRARSPWLAEAMGNLFFHLQPIVRLADGSVLGYEALVRAALPGRVVGAGPLLEAAEAHGQLRALDGAARAEALRQVYPRLGEGQLLFINFSPNVVYNPDVCLNTTMAVCREVRADFSRLVFEVTESEAFPHLELLRAILGRYQREGARVALDDLGTGHTSLVYLEELRPDFVKLDRALVSGIRPRDPRARLVASLVDYAHDLGVRVLAEGIETESELALARDLGADYAQGYFLGRPALELTPTAPAAAALLAPRALELAR